MRAAARPGAPDARVAALAPGAPDARVAALALTALAIGLALACGKKGPPLPPLPGMRPAVSDLAVRQLGAEAHATFNLPLRPASPEIDYATLAVELWRRPHDEAASKSEAEEGIARFRETAVMAVALQGEALLDFLAAPAPVVVDPLPPEILAGGPLEYALILKTNAARRGTLSNLVVLTPHPPPPPPRALVATLEEGGIRLDIEPPAPAAEPEAAPAAEPEEAAAPAPELRFNVFRADGTRDFAPEPLNEKPLATPSFVDKSVLPGRTYRYLARSLAEIDGDRVESAPSSVVTAEFRDVFAPGVPTGLRLILEGRRAVNLIWNPNDEPDLGGYAVYRREPGGEWARLDAGGARTATFTDANVGPGRTYEYAVTAHDTAREPNESEKCSPQSIQIPAVAGLP